VLVTVTVYPPETPLQDSIELPDPVKLVGVTPQVIPEAGLIVDVRLTIPAKPCKADRVIVEVPWVPARIVTLVGLAATVKSCTV